MTVSDLAVESPLSVEESKRALERFVDQGVADTWVSEFGQIVYVFPAFFDEGDKHTASSPLEDPLEESFEQLENRTTLDFDGQQAPRRQQQSARSQGHDHKS
jgi:hypothetical protein